ncbi:2,4-dienoyl-CoA reductase [Natronincola peptidivorans]|uniref:2,4-dienoyl-CoA reductase n=1 Tax=Natronincola peptidivorans TaxID=426128 RepID=A0A1H9Y4U1_9FIRM|nr:NAD(P)/FAD-dependent oxidoreductase [Natronincola peptidivorans]SES63387.1 2,4-dienoyl-CoA reductase [Natronincola peptidivorans]
MKYEKLFSKGRIGKLELKNRVVMPAMGTSLAGSNGEASSDIIKYYEERAKGGCGLIITEITRIDEEFGVGVANQLSATAPKHIASFQKLARTLHKYDTKVFVQLHHPGREGHGNLIGGKQIVAPSPIMCKVTKEMPRELTTEEVEGLVKKFITGAKIAQMGGIDGVELHGAHGYLINQFLSPYTNKRTDKYGGHFMNRMRFISEIIVGIKHICGPDFPISVRIDGDEFVEGGIDLKEAVKIARYLESLGVDVLNVSCGTYETSMTIIEPMSYPQGWKKHLAQTIKQAVAIPVIAVNVIRKPDFAEGLLQDGVVDFVGVGRGQLADSAWSKKAIEGMEEEIKPCISCLHCIEELGKGGVLKCAVNPMMGRELEFNHLQKDGADRTVVIIGAGPAGLEAARVLALRGFKPIVLERENELGGALQLANKPFLKDKIDWLINYYENQIRTLNIDIRFGTKATIDNIKDLNPYAIFAATGSKPIVPPIEGIQSEKVCVAEDILKGDIAPEGESIAVIGSGMTGCETAEMLAMKGNKVSIVEMRKEIGMDVYKINLFDLLKRLKEHKVEMLPSKQLLKVIEDGIVLMDTFTTMKTVKSVDRVVLALGVQPNREIIPALEQEFKHVHVMGDVMAPGRIADAIRQGFEKAYILE